MLPNVPRLTALRVMPAPCRGGAALNARRPAAPRAGELGGGERARNGADDARSNKAPPPPPPPTPAPTPAFPLIRRRRLRALVKVMTKAPPTPATADASPPVRRRRALIGAAAVAAAVSGRAGGARAAAAGGEAATAVSPPATAPPPPPPPPPDPPVTQVAYLDLAVGGKPAGRIEIGLFGTAVPKTVANFTALAGAPTDDVGRASPLAGKYVGTAFHRLVPGFVLQGGDWERGNGTGGASIYGRTFPDEAFLRHGGPGAVSMANRGPNTGGSQFFVTLAPTPWLDGKHVVFGRATPQSMALLAKVVEGAEVDFFSKPRAPITIVGAGLVEAAAAASTEEEEAGG